MIGWVYAVGRILGFGTAGGVRPFLTLAVIGAMDRIGIGPEVQFPFGFLDHWVTILIFAAIAIFESKFDNVPALTRVQDRLLLPWRVAAGAIAGAATTGHGITGLIVGLVLGALVGWVGQSVKHGARPKGQPAGIALALISLSEDLFALVGSVATALFAPLGYAFFAVTVWLFVWMRQRRTQRLRGLARRNE